jgi:hypothetical protein
MIEFTIFAALAGKKYVCRFSAMPVWQALDTADADLPPGTRPHEINEIMLVDDSGGISRFIFPPFLELEDDTAEG